jgi:hypothetical protein
VITADTIGDRAMARREEAHSLGHELQRQPAADLEPLLGEEVERQVDRDRLRPHRLGLDPDQAVRAEELDLVDRAVEDIGVARRDRPRQDVFRPQVDLDVALGGGVVLAREPARADAQVATRVQAPREDVDLADEVGDERRRRIAIDLHRRADLLDHPVVHHDDAIGDRKRLFLVVRDHDGGHAELSLQRADLAAQAHALERVERRQRLVEQEQARRRRQRACQRDALLLAARQLRRELGAAARQADELQQLLDARRRRRPGDLAVDQAVGDVVGDREVGKERVRLEDDAVVALCRRQHRDVALALQDAAGGLRLEAGDDAQERRLAAARRAEKADELAPRDRQVDVLERLEGPERLADAFEAEVVRSGHATGSFASLRMTCRGIEAPRVTSSARTCCRIACSTRQGCARGCRRRT